MSKEMPSLRDATLTVAALMVIVVLGALIVMVAFGPYPPCSSGYYQMQFLGTTVCRMNQ